MNVVHGKCLSWVPRRFTEAKSRQEGFNSAKLALTVSTQTSGIRIVIEKIVVSWPEETSLYRVLYSYSVKGHNQGMAS